MSSGVSVICPGCGVTRRGVWDRRLAARARKVGAFSRNLDRPLCCDRLKGRPLRVTYNNYPNFFGMTEEGELDMKSHEPDILHLFIRKYGLIPSYRNAKFKWGSQNITTGIWDGLVGNVSFTPSQF